MLLWSVAPRTLNPHLLEWTIDLISDTRTGSTRGLMTAQLPPTDPLNGIPPVHPDTAVAPRLDPPVVPSVDPLPGEAVVSCDLVRVVWWEVLPMVPASRGPSPTIALSTIRWLGAGVLDLAPWKFAERGVGRLVVPPRPLVVLMVVRVVVSRLRVVPSRILVVVSLLPVRCRVVSLVVSGLTGRLRPPGSIRRWDRDRVRVVRCCPPALCLLMVVPSECRWTPVVLRPSILLTPSSAHMLVPLVRTLVIRLAATVLRL